MTVGADAMDLATIERCLSLLGRVEGMLLDNERGLLAAHLSIVTGRLHDERATKLAERVPA